MKRISYGTRQVDVADDYSLAFEQWVEELTTRISRLITLQSGNQVVKDSGRGQMFISVPCVPVESETPTIVKFLISSTSQVVIEDSPRDLPDPDGTSEAVKEIHQRLRRAERHRLPL